MTSLGSLPSPPTALEIRGGRRLATGRRCPAVLTRSSSRQVLNAAEDVVADYGGHLLLISEFKGPDKRVVLPNRFGVRPPGLRALKLRNEEQVAAIIRDHVL